MSHNINETGRGLKAPEKVLQWCESSGQVETFRNQNGDPFATFKAEGGSPTVPVLSSSFENELLAAYLRTTGAALKRDALATVARCLSVSTRNSTKRVPVCIRRGHHEGRLYIDIGDDSQDVIQVDTDGWRVIPTAESPVRFYRPHGMAALARPETTNERLESLIEPLIANSTRSRNQRRLILSFIVHAIHGRGPFPMLSISGPQGSSKSGMSKLIRALVDPADPPMRSYTNKVQDLWIAASHCAILVLDNVSTLSAECSDAGCGITSGGAYAARSLYTNGDEHVIKACCPIIFNGIPQVAERSDLLSRTLVIRLKPISDNDRLTNSDYERRVQQAAPAIIGAALDAVVAGMRRLPNTRVQDGSRLSDFTTWACACEDSLGWESGAFLAAFRESKTEAHSEALEASPIFVPLRDELEKQGGWNSTATKLMAALLRRLDDQPRPDGWPRSPKQLGQEISRLEADLAAIGWHVEHEKVKGERILLITRSR